MARRRKRSLGSPFEMHEEAYDVNIHEAQKRIREAKSCRDIHAVMRSIGRADAHSKSSGSAGLRMKAKADLSFALARAEALGRDLCGCKR